MNETIGPIRAMFTSIASTAVFRAVPRMKAAPLMTVLVLLALVPAAIKTIQAHAILEVGLRDLAENYDANLPPLRLEDGRVTVDGDEPAIYPRPDAFPEDADASDFVVIYDTTGEIREIPDGYRGGILVTAEAVIFDNGLEREELAVADIHQLTGDLVLDGEFFRQEGETWLAIFAVVVGVVLAIGSVTVKLFQALLLGALGLALSGGHAGFTYGVSFKVAVVALAPSILLDTALTAFVRDIPFLLYFSVAILYMWLGTRQAVRAADGPDDNDPATWDFSGSSVAAGAWRS